MRTISVVLALVGVILVMTNLRTPTGMDLALSQRPLAAPCQPGSPTRMSIPALGVDALIETIGLDRRARPDDSGQAPLGAPVDQHKAGWYAAGPKPGSGMGTVLTNGHTYRDGSAIFQQDFAALVAVGQRIDLVLDNGTTCSYRIPRYGAMSTPSRTTRNWSPASACTTSRAQSGSFLQRAAALGSKVPGCSRTSISSWPPQCPAEPNGPTFRHPFSYASGVAGSPPLRMRPEGRGFQDPPVVPQPLR